MRHSLILPFLFILNLKAVIDQLILQSVYQLNYAYTNILITWIMTQMLSIGTDIYCNLISTRSILMFNLFPEFSKNSIEAYLGFIEKQNATSYEIAILHKIKITKILYIVDTPSNDTCQKHIECVKTCHKGIFIPKEVFFCQQETTYLAKIN